MSDRKIQASKQAKSASGALEFEGVEGAVGLGVDIVEIARMKAILKRTPSFKTRVFSEDERAYCDKTAQPAIHYATRFAAKEAVLKALGTGFSQGIGVRDIEVYRNAKGRPLVHLYGRAKEIASEMGVREIPISLSYTHTDAVACAMAITEESVRVKEERVNPLEELSKQFKEARALLDEVPGAPSSQQTPSQQTPAQS
ncbi:holo-ACP synthase [Eggerthellaceae bacterium 3-80]